LICKRKGVRMKIPTPLNGWRVFLGEVGVIVLGVLLALGAQQVVEDIQIRSDVRKFRKTIDHEIGLNLFVYEVRSRGSACNEKRMKELFDWVETARDGQELPKISTGGPLALTPYTSAWDTRDGKVFAHVPAKARQKYAEFYDELEGNTERIKWEVDEWFALQRYALPGPVSLDDRRTIYGHLRKALVLNAVWHGNMTISGEIADELGVKAVRPDNIPANFLSELGTCDSIFEPKDSGKDAGRSTKS
jgi:hypothetical protein